VTPDESSPEASEPTPTELGVALVLPSVTDGQWHRLHPATPLLRGGLFIVAVLGFVIANLRERLFEIFFDESTDGNDPIDVIVRNGVVGWALLGIAVVLIVILVVFTLSWRMHTFRVTSDVVEVRSGVVFRSSRRARLDRVQGVNLVRPFIPRLFGAARLEVSVAGQDGNVQLAYLGSSLADGLRHDILRLASGLRQNGTSAVASAGAVASADGAAATMRAADASAHVSPSAPTGAHPTLGDLAQSRVSDFLAPELDPDAAAPESIVRIPPGRLIGSVVSSGFTVFVLLAITALIVSAVVGGPEWLLIAILPGLVGSFGYYYSRFVKSLRFSIAATNEGVRVGFGLLSTSSETLPSGRVHAIGVSQSLLWRPFGWWQVQINKAGHSSNSGAAGAANTVILPVGTLDDVCRVLELLVPSFAGEEQRTLIERGLRSRGGSDGFVNAPRAAAWLRPFSWRRTGYAVSRGVTVLRRGVLARELVLVPLARLQSVRISQGPLHRRLGLATATLHTVSGPVSARLSVMSRREALQLFELVSRGAIAAAEIDTNDTTPTTGPVE